MFIKHSFRSIQFHRSLYTVTPSFISHHLKACTPLSYHKSTTNSALLPYTVEPTRSYITTNNTATTTTGIDLPYTTSISGVVGTPQYRIYFYPDQQSAASIGGKSISPWHDIPYKTTCKDGNILYSYINEISLNTVEKYEIATKEVSNPIKQDVKKGMFN